MATFRYVCMLYIWSLVIEDQPDFGSDVTSDTFRFRARRRLHNENVKEHTEKKKNHCACLPKMPNT